MFICFYKLYFVKNLNCNKCFILFFCILELLIDNRKIDEMGIWFLDVVLINDFENVEECLIYLELLK